MGVVLDRLDLVGRDNVGKRVKDDEPGRGRAYVERSVGPLIERAVRGVVRERREGGDGKSVRSESSVRREDSPKVESRSDADEQEGMLERDGRGGPKLAS